MKNTSQNQAAGPWKPKDISKSRFKFIIDEIEQKIGQNSRSSEHLKSSFCSYNIKTNSHEIDKTPKLSLYLSNDYRKIYNQQIQKQISVNLEFNKLYLIEKKKFLEHYPNDKDLAIYLPQISLDKKTKINQKQHFLSSYQANGWKLNHLIVKKRSLITEISEYEPKRGFAKLKIEEITYKNHGMKYKTGKQYVKKKQNLSFDRLNVKAQAIKFKY